MPYTCPVCGYNALPEPPQNFSICPSCGTEFGLDDAKYTHLELQAEWIKAGPLWFSTARPAPVHWDPWLQLINAGYGFSIPFKLRVVNAETAVNEHISLVPNVTQISQLRMTPA